MQLGLSAMMYANEDPAQMWPSLSSEPGRLMWITSVAPEYSPDPAGYVCHEDPDWRALLKVSAKRGLEMKPGYGLADFVDDWSFFYLGHVVLDDADVETFAQHYKTRMAAGESDDGDIPLPVTKEVFFPRPPSMTIGTAPTRTESTSTYDRLYQLREGIERFLISDDPSPGASAWAQSKIPVLIERLGNHDPPGGNVLYLDHHIEFIPYGEWPMTEKTINTLLELDALGDQ